MNILPLESTLTSYFQFPAICNDDMVVARTSDVVAILAALNLGS
jgi:hypothetical protein